MGLRERNHPRKTGQELCVNTLEAKFIEKKYKLWGKITSAWRMRVMWHTALTSKGIRETLFWTKYRTIDWEHWLQPMFQCGSITGTKQGHMSRTSPDTFMETLDRHRKEGNPAMGLDVPWQQSELLSWWRLVFFWYIPNALPLCWNNARPDRCLKGLTRARLALDFQHSNSPDVSVQLFAWPCGTFTLGVAFLSVLKGITENLCISLYPFWIPFKLAVDMLKNHFRLLFV